MVDDVKKVLLQEKNQLWGVVMQPDMNFSCSYSLKLIVFQ